MTPSKYQKAVYDFIQNEGGSAIVKAVAGSGKTTTVVSAVNMIPADKSILMLAFNKSIADELKARVPAHVDVKTFNGLGHTILAKALGRLNLDGYKLRKAVKDRMADGFDYKVIGQQVVELVGYARRSGLLPNGVTGKALMEDTPESWSWLIDHFGLAIEKDFRQSVIDYSRLVIADCVNLAANKRVIDFDDQIYIPAIKGLPADKYDFVIVDESQDVSPVRTKLISMVLKPETGRLIAVGDPYQAIYGFTGSDSAAMQTLGEQFQCKTLPLSVSYRCSKAVVAAARQVMPDIEPSEAAPEGSVQALDTWTADELKGGDMVLCRTNAPIVSLAWKLIGMGVPCRILGRDIASGIIKLIESLQPRGLNGSHGLVEKIAQWRSQEVQKWLKEDREDMVQQVEDKAQCIKTIAERTSVRTVPDLLRSIESMFSDDGGESSKLVTLCSMHKSKGLEAERVFILDMHLLPLKHAKQAWQLEQEYNLKYVALTRAKRDLFLVLSENFKETKKGKAA